MGKYVTQCDTKSDKSHIAYSLVGGMSNKVHRPTRICISK